MQEMRRLAGCYEELAADCFSSAGGYCKGCMREYQKEHAKRKRRDPADSESDSEPSDPVGPSAPHAPDLYIFSNSLLPGILKIGRTLGVGTSLVQRVMGLSAVPRHEPWNGGELRITQFSIFGPSNKYRGYFGPA